MPRADLDRQRRHVRFVPNSDIGGWSREVGLTSDSGPPLVARVCRRGASRGPARILELAGPFDGLIQVSSAPFARPSNILVSSLTPLEAVHGHCPFFVALLLSMQLPSRHGSANNPAFHHGLEEMPQDVAPSEAAMAVASAADGGERWTGCWRRREKPRLQALYSRAAPAPEIFQKGFEISSSGRPGSPGSSP